MVGEMMAPLPDTEDFGDPEDLETSLEPRTGVQESLRVRGLSKSFGFERVLDDVSFSIAEGESLVLLGHSGSGKSTTLRLIAGLETPDAGEIFLHGKPITHLSARQRNLGVIFQNYALFHQMTVAENIGFGLRLRGAGRKEREQAVGELLALIGLTDQRHKYPAQISGGQQQRVAIARALAYRPELLLFDESFSALDPQTRVGLRREIRTLLKQLRIPALFITHDQDEAMELGDQIAILNQGRLEQVGTPDTVYNNPRTEFVATFLGAANVIEGRWREGLIRLDGDRCLSAPRLTPLVTRDRVKVVFRPEDIILGHPTGLIETPHHLGGGQVLDVSFTGASESLVVGLLPKRPADHTAESNRSCDLVINVLRTKWDARRMKLGPGDLVSVGLRSYKVLRA